MPQSYRMPVSDKQRRVGRAIQRAQRELAKAMAEEGRHGVTQQAIAEKLGIGRSVVNRRVTGRANLTLRSMAELAWALDRDLAIEFVAKKVSQEMTRGHAEPVSWKQHSPKEPRAHASPVDIEFKDVERLFELLQRSATMRMSNDNGYEIAHLEAA
jgi:transcriptional regulator with XRE-family HTH domain